ncbi:unnamed protein product [Fusarium graminearum]|nr:unnamed protein product [Fusarium graminearum]
MSSDARAASEHLRMNQTVEISGSQVVILYCKTRLPGNNHRYDPHVKREISSKPALPATWRDD